MTTANQHQAIRVVAGPANYFSYSGSLAQLRAFFTPQQLNNAFWLYGARAFAATREWLPEGVWSEQARQSEFSGHCNKQQVAQLAEVAGSDRSVVIGIGGGRVLDTAKALARQLGVPFVAIPTIAATCAAWTPLSVWYDNANQAIGFDVFDDANHLVLVEPEIILRAPQDYLLAGVGDTLAKWHEAVVLCPHPERLPLTARLGLDSARTIHDILLEQGEQALQQQQHGQAGQAFLNVVDAIIAGGGLVGGLGERYTRVAAAHALHNGLTVLPATHAFLHGTKVAYGILVQAALLGDEQTLQQLIVAFRRFQLPVSLAQLGVSIDDDRQIDALIQHTLRPQESIHLLPSQVTAPRLREALHRVARVVSETEASAL
jgi:uncharacterized oxidoreductase